METLDLNVAFLGLVAIVAPAIASAIVKFLNGSFIAGWSDMAKRIFYFATTWLTNVIATFAHHAVTDSAETAGVTFFTSLVTSALGALAGLFIFKKAEQKEAAKRGTY